MNQEKLRQSKIEPDTVVFALTRRGAEDRQICDESQHCYRVRKMCIAAENP